jgi:hypothetical protein
MVYLTSLSVAQAPQSPKMTADYCIMEVEKVGIVAIVEELTKKPRKRNSRSTVSIFEPRTSRT